MLFTVLTIRSLPISSMFASMHRVRFKRRRRFLIVAQDGRNEAFVRERPGIVGRHTVTSDDSAVLG
jgi:hypothetical protein